MYALYYTVVESVSPKLCLSNWNHAAFRTPLSLRFVAIGMPHVTDSDPQTILTMVTYLKQ